MSDYDAKEQLLIRLEGDLDYRVRMVERFPDDERNQAACDVIEFDILPFVRELPDDDPRFARLTQAEQTIAADDFLVDVEMEMTWTYAARIGFQGGPPDDPEQWLETYITEREQWAGR